MDKDPGHSGTDSDQVISDAPEQDEIDRQLKSIKAVAIRPIDLARMKRRVMRAIRMNLSDEDEEIKILQMAPTEIRTCSRGPRCSRKP